MKNSNVIVFVVEFLAVFIFLYFSCKSELTQQDVIAAIQVNQQFDFLTNHHLGLRYDEIKEISQDSTSW